MSGGDLILGAPLKGWASTLDTVPDAVFAQRMLGDGVAIDPLGATLHAPCDGVVLTLHAAGHALTLRSAEGAEILMHIGMDTVALAGDGFTPHVREGQQVARGEALIAFDLDRLAARAPSLMTPIIVTNPDRFRIDAIRDARAVDVGDPLMTLVAIGEAAAEPQPKGVQHSRSVVVPLAHGIHARPAAHIVAALQDLTTDIAIVHGNRWGNARSAIALLGLGIQHGDRITIEASGPDAPIALNVVADLIESGMGEAGPPPVAAAAVAPTAEDALPSGTLKGVTAAPGLAIGPAFRLRTEEVAVAAHADDPFAEHEKLEEALFTVRADLARRVEGDGAGAAIMAAHLAFLDDPELADAAGRHIADGASAGHAWRQAIERQAAVLRESGNARLIERIADLRDVELQVLRALSGTQDMAVTLPAGCILIADDLLPSQLVGMDTTRLAGLCTAAGGPTSHVAILAGALGLPALVAVGSALDAIRDGTTLILRADQAQLVVAPDRVMLDEAQAEVATRAARRSAAQARAQDESRTRDGVPIEAFANLGSIADAQAAVAHGAEGCGLLRTEFLFLDRDAAPDAIEQAAAYQGIADALGARPLIVRLLDIGGDKPAPYWPMVPEENPALGLRGIRVGLANPSVLETQLRAILAVRPIGQCRIMVPMVADLAELRSVRAMLDSLRAELDIADRIELGIMVETPAAAMIADVLAAEADFLSIGTNDLTQYTLAMDRGNPAVAAGIDALHPGVLRLIAATCQGAARHGRWTGVCGGLASDPLAVPILIGLGVTELSSTPAMVPEVKALVRRVTLPACRDHAVAALAAASAADVRARATAFARELQP